MIMDATLRRLLNYHSWAMENLFSHLDTLPKVPPVCMKLMQHTVNAESIWTSRITGQTPIVGVWEERPLPESLDLHRESSAMLEQILSTTMDLDKEISYVNTAGDHFVNSVHDILIHVINHATYHRAQVAKELRSQGLEPINTDYISYVRLAL